jgi:hypothetical protein
MLKRIIVGSTIAAAGWAAFYAAGRWRATWGVDPSETERPLPGDDLVPVAAAVDTRGITIEAPPSAVWPWLVQMGYGRAGWYSYDRLDMRGRSADRIHPEWQGLAVGDVMATDPGGGFVVRELVPERALVVFADSDLVAEQRGTAGIEAPVAELPLAEAPVGEAAVTKLPVAEAAATKLPVAEAPGLAASGRFMGAAMPPRFGVSWAFVLEPAGDGQTRLIERVRFGMEGESRGSRMLGPTLGFGVFVMVQRQLRGIRDRVEAAGRQPVPVMAEPDMGVARPETGPVPATAATA